ncbi:MAG: thioredoxin family protein [Fimbriimonas sp.]|nr:thioredoxin family protein [Fimbriimonas sp.]
MRVLTSLFALVAAASVLAGPPSSAELLAKASTAAKKDGSNVLVIFHASWCGWCKRFDKFLDTTDEGKLVKSGLEVVHITVLESGAQKADENAGGLDLMIKLGGKDAGLPFMAILDAKTGKMIVNSLQKAGNARTNTGYPAAPEEIGHFVSMLQKGAPKMGDGSVRKVEAWLKANAPK